MYSDYMNLYRISYEVQGIRDARLLSNYDIYLAVSFLGLDADHEQGPWKNADTNAIHSLVTLAQNGPGNLDRG